MRKMKFIVALLLAVCFVPAQGEKSGAAGGWSARRVSSADGLPSNTVNDMAQDSLGYVWMATGNGLCRYDGFRAAFDITEADQGTVQQNGIPFPKSEFTQRFYKFGSFHDNNSFHI